MKRVFFAVCALSLLYACTSDEGLEDSLYSASGGSLTEDAGPALVTYDWPTDEGQANISEHYEIYVTCGDGEEEQLEVLQSDAIYWQYDGSEDSRAGYLEGRTFSFVMVSYDQTSGEELTFRVVAKSMSADQVVLAPRSYGYEAVGAGSETTIKVDESSRYISVNFDCAENRIQIGDGDDDDWIKHMLCIFVDPKEVNPPSLYGAGVVNFATATETELINASTIYFPAGYYNLASYSDKGSVVRATHEGRIDGKFLYQAGQTIYIEGGAFIEGYIQKQNYRDQVTVKGRGIVTGRQYLWNAPAYSDDSSSKQITNMINSGDNSIFEGIMVMESPNHGIVGTEYIDFQNVKFLGWHANNDGLRPGDNSTISNCFIRACDDFFYNYQITVTESVLWPAHNGGILTFGWNNISLGGGCLEDIDIIHTEWIALGGNKGLLTSINNPGFEVKDGTPTTTLRNIRVEGKVPGFVNLKLADEDGAELEAGSTPGWLGNILFEDIYFDEVIGEGGGTTMNCNSIAGRKGETVVAGDPDAIWWVKDIEFKNVMLGDIKLTNANKLTYIVIDEETTENIIFED